MKAATAILALALAGCATYHDPRETPQDVSDCKAAGREARKLGPAEENLFIGPIVARHLAQNRAYTECMQVRGYATSRPKG